MAGRWTDSEDDLLAAMYADGAAMRDIAAAVGRSANACSARRAALGTASRRRARLPAARLDALIRAAAAANVPCTVLAGQLGLAVDHVRARRRDLGLAAPTPRRYSASEDELIREACRAGRPLTGLAAQLGRSAGALRVRAAALGEVAPRPQRRWTRSDDELLREGYARGLRCEIISGELLPDRSTEAITARARKLGLANYARTWTQAEHRMLIELARHDATVPDIAERLVRSTEAIRQRAPVGHRRARRTRKQGQSALARRGGRAAAHMGGPGRRASGNDARSLRPRGRMRLRVIGIEAQHSPHRQLPARNGDLAPAERSLLERERSRVGTVSEPFVRALAQRLERSPDELREALRR